MKSVARLVTVTVIGCNALVSHRQRSLDLEYDEKLALEAGKEHKKHKHRRRGGVAPLTKAILDGHMNNRQTKELMDAEGRKAFRQMNLSNLHVSKEVKDFLHGEQTGQKGLGDELDDEKIDLARDVLNTMLLDAFGRVDAIVKDCKQELIFDETEEDLLSGKISELRTEVNEKLGEQTECSSKAKTQEIAIELLDDEVSKKKAVKDADVSRLEAELADVRKEESVYAYIVHLTRPEECETWGDEGAFLQNPPNKIKKCPHHKHPRSFTNQKLNTAMMQLSEKSREKAQRALAASEQDPADSGTESSTTTAAPTVETAGSNDPAKDSSAYKCSLADINCGVLHDNMSLEWGERKDTAEDLADQLEVIRRDWDEFNTFMQTTKQLMMTYKQTQSDFVAEATTIIQGRVEIAEKVEGELNELISEMEEKEWHCTAQINQILNEEICGVRTARNKLQDKHTTVKGADIDDCVVGAWIPQPCEKTCNDELGDDGKPLASRMLLTRDIVSKNENDYGIKCEDLAREWEMACGRRLCPKDCVSGPFSDWGECSAQCGGGFTSRSRQVVAEQQNGGLRCGAGIEQQVCNEHSCNEACILEKEWDTRPCSMACDETKRIGEQRISKYRGGVIISRKHVAKPAVREGTCPRAHSRTRFAYKKCNERKKCYDDERCIAKVDVVFLVDASGSVRERGFDVLVEFTRRVIERLETEFNPEVDVQSQLLSDVPEEDLDLVGQPAEPVEDDEPPDFSAVRVGTVLFGNGALADDGSVSSAIKLVKKLVSPEEALASLDGVEWQKGFTNMAQGIVAANAILGQNGRKNAQSVIVVVSDGVPSFEYETENQVHAAKREGKKFVQVMVKKNAPDEQRKLIRAWASLPRQTNFVEIKGLERLERDMEMSKHPKFVSKVIRRMCSKTISIEEQHELIAEQQAEAFGDFQMEEDEAYGM